MNCEEILQLALKNSSGWRTKAREFFGNENIQCLGCNKLFAKGGRRSLFCSEACRILRDPRIKKMNKKLCSKCKSPLEKDNG